MKIRNIINYYFIIDNMKYKTMEMSIMIFTVVALWQRVNLNGFRYPVMDAPQNLLDQKFDCAMTSAGVL